MATRLCSSSLFLRSRHAWSLCSGTDVTIYRVMQQRYTVTPMATDVLRTDLMQMCQRRDKPFRAFAARVRGKADTCAFFAICQCGQKVDYTDLMIRDTLLKDICDAEIRLEVLGTANIITTAISDVIAIVEIKEIAQNAAPVSDVSAVSAFKRQKTASVAHDRSEKSPCPDCKQLFSLYSKAPRGWNSKPHTLCLDCFRSRRRKKHRLHQLPFRMKEVIHPLTKTAT